MVLETEMQNYVDEVLRLDFGKCSLKVQVPESSPYKSAADLAGKRVVTSFEVLAGQHFGKIDDQLNLVGENRTKIDYVGGSVEAACSLGLADGIGQCARSFGTSRSSPQSCLQSTSLVCNGPSLSYAGLMHF